ncbi:TrlF family AAA-like ATPase [Paenibacillus dauci]|uniref:TrlF family AAA-like ATPase n=1 Tax=Paenibacillus dauci TaxID=1567106 RepID=UPI00061975B4|nr:PHP-associated domain-containing protein [Paenibacillus dauci]
MNQHYGATWKKFDFHTHTPASNDYRQLDQVVTPRNWLLKYMEKEIDCVAVTDHNSSEWVNLLKDELVAMRAEQCDGFRELVIFPGVEISVNGNIHLLAIFSPEVCGRAINDVLARSKYFGAYGHSDTCTECSYNDVINIIHSHGGIAIPAHVDGPKGLFEEEKGLSLETCLNAKGVLAIQVCNITYEKPQVYIDSKLNYTEISGSDSHSIDTIGQIYTWVKMDNPNIDALRLALHDGEDGIIRSDVSLNNPNDINQRFYIKSIVIENGAKAGRGKPLKIDFSPWLNTIIGGRGSGKSSIIEYLRLPFNKVSGLPGKIKESFEEFNQVPKERGKTGMLTEGTKIKVLMQKDGREVALTWTNSGIKEEFQNENKNWEEKELSDNVSLRFPLRIFSQKQLYTLTEDPHHIMNIIDEQFNKTEWDQQYEELSNKWMQNRARKRELFYKVKEKGNLLSELDDILAKMKVFEESGYKSILDNYAKAQSALSKFEVEKVKIDNLNVQVQELVKVYPIDMLEFNQFDEIDVESNTQLHELSEEINNIIIEFNLISSKIADFNSRISSKIESIPYYEKINNHCKDYEEFVERLEESGEQNPNAYGELVFKQQEIEKKLKRTSEYEEEMQAYENESTMLLTEINLHQQNLRKYRQNVIERWQGSNSNIKIYLNVMGNIENAENTFRNIIRKNGKEFTKDILEKDDDNIPHSGILYNLSMSASIWEDRIKLINDIQNTSNLKTTKRFIMHIDSLLINTPEDIDRLSLWYPEDKIVLKLASKNKEEDIETGSAGQRTAAMLSLMLLLDDSPIIIDQPEEDLDTKRITDLVVSGLREFKNKQQVIIVTHNPNIPVNGAAENIIQMNFAGGMIQKQISGALQKNDVREAICEIMEGGKEALNKRYFRISKALGD